MKNNKVIDLLKKGLSHQTISKLTESQINTLHSKLISEQVTQVNKPAYQIKGSTGTLTAPMPKGATVSKNPDGTMMVTPNESEMREEKKYTKSSPFQICTSQLGKEFGTTKRSMWSAKETNKYERCVKDVEKSLKEGKNPVSLFLEEKIMKLVEKHIPPRITKKDLINYLSEDTTTAPSKPKTDPTTKPGTRPKPKHPGQNPNPGENPAPKAAVSPEKAKEEVIDLIINLLSK
jgi:hypothetical protein